MNETVFNEDGWIMHLQLDANGVGFLSRDEYHLGKI